MARFSHRPKRLSRRAEREKFNLLVMPAAYLCLPLAVAIMAAVALSYLIYESFPREIFALGLAALAIPFSLALFRVMRGHYSDSLDEP